MSRSNDAENNYLLLLFNNTDWANIGDATGLQGSPTPGSFHVSLHTGDPGEAGEQTTSEATFGAYARQAVARSGAGWTVTTNTATNAAAITWAECTSGSETITHVGIGRDAGAGAGMLLWSGTLDASRAVSSGITLQFNAGDLDITAD